VDPVPCPALILITDEALPPARILDVVDAACQVGCPLVQLRNRLVSARVFHELAVELRRITSAHRSRLIINDRIDVALAVAADGVHLPESGMPTACARSILGASAILGRSAHSPEAVAALKKSSLDYVQFGPVYETESKRAFGAPQGLARLRDSVLAADGLPVIAVGGVDAERALRIRAAGASGIAVIGAIMRSGEPAAATAALLSALRGDPRSSGD
jgi:thiamine-phosphate pyrophosphorylase